MPTAVAPAPQTSPTVDDLALTHDADAVHYEIVASRNLPSITLSRSVKSQILSRRAGKTYNTVMRRALPIVVIGYNLVLISIPVVLVLPTDVGRQVAAIMAPVGLPGITSALLSLRYDVLRLLLCTYDVWFFLVVVLTTSACLVIYLADARAAVAFALLGGNLTCILIDANLTLMKMFTTSAVLGNILGLAIVIVVQLDLVSNPNDLRIRYNSHTLSLPDVISNGVFTLFIVITRNAYRRRAALQAKTVHRSTMQCISFRCLVKLQRISAARAQEIRRSQVGARRSSLVRSWKPESVVSTLRLVPINHLFDGRRVLSGYQRSLNPWSATTRLGLRLIAVFSGVLSTVLFFTQILLDGPPRPLLCSVALAGTCVLSQVTWAMSHPALLRQLWFSFDFAFMSLQLTILHVGICDTFSWDSRALLIVAGWIWIHWVLILDAVVPLTKQRIGIVKWMPAAVVAAFVMAQALYLAKLVVAKDWDLFDRVLVEKTIVGHRLHVRIVPMLFSRLPMLICWSLRLLWRTCRTRDGELVMLQGAVMYDCHNRREEQRIGVATTHPIH